ncbi:uncharacterized protein UTRI_10524_B [Ustilago trichophora]|uniref:Trafficking protein particle complex subunit 2-like protein n=1 Tax=Ustilago trichophora TaxID=86804 RepID=A0A5C3EAK9_9BASI|nr:uncharacterized protein UTRI_10524_B [Ustilago trichophora]
MSSSTPRIQALAIISPRNGPIYMRQFGSSTSESSSHAADLRYHYFAHAALDVMDERSASSSRTNAEQYLGLLYTLEDLAIYGFQSCTRLRFLLMLSLTDHAVRDIDMLTLFKAVYSAWLKYSANPFHSLPPTNFAKSADEENDSGRAQRELEQRQTAGQPVQCRQIRSATFDARIDRIVFGSSKTASTSNTAARTAAPLTATR